MSEIVVKVGNQDLQMYDLGKAMNNQFVKTTIDTAVQNIQTFNENVNAFADLNKTIVQSWTNPFTQTN